MSIRKIINKWDPANLLRIGAPDDEYDYEILEIRNYIKKNRNVISVELLGVEIKEIFEKAFASAVKMDSLRCNEIAAEIINDIN